MLTHFPEFPAIYDPPQDTLRRVREVDPSADVLYFGWGRWYLVRHRPNREHIATAHRRLGEAWRLLEAWRTGTTMQANPGAFRRLYGRYLFWRAIALGARPVADYDARFVRQFGLDAIADDFRCMEWMYRNTSDQDVLTAVNAEKDRAREQAAADLRDPNKGKDAWRYLFTRSHGVTRYDDPERHRPRSGFTTVATIGAGGYRRQA